MSGMHKGFPSTKHFNQLDWEALSSRSGSSSDANAVRCERGRYWPSENWSRG